jgi:hypothetical protein
MSDLREDWCGTVVNGGFVQKASVPRIVRCAIGGTGRIEKPRTRAARGTAAAWRVFRAGPTLLRPGMEKKRHEKRKRFELIHRTQRRLARKAEEFQHKGTKINTKTHKENKKVRREKMAKSRGHKGDKEQCRSGVFFVSFVFSSSELFCLVLCSLVLCLLCVFVLIFVPLC